MSTVVSVDSTSSLGFYFDIDKGLEDIMREAMLVSNQVGRYYTVGAIRHIDDEGYKDRGLLLCKWSRMDKVWEVKASRMLFVEAQGPLGKQGSLGQWKELKVGGGYKSLAQGIKDVMSLVVENYIWFGIGE